MIPSLIICIASGLFFLLICYGKRREQNGGRPIIRIGSDSLDYKLSQYYLHKREYLASVDSKYVKDKLHIAAENLEHFGIYIVEKAVQVLRSFGKAKNRVTGEGLPKNKGAVAFFLDHVGYKKRSK